MDLDFRDNFIVKGKISIKDTKTEYKSKLTKEAGKKMLLDEKMKLRELQERLYADSGKFSVSGSFPSDHMTTHG